MVGDSPAGISSDELTGAVGPPDAAELQTIRDIFLHEEPIVEDAMFDNILSPKELCVTFADGIGVATWCLFDITWYASGAYRFTTWMKPMLTGDSIDIRITIPQKSISTNHRQQIHKRQFSHA